MSTKGYTVLDPIRRVMRNPNLPSGPVEFGTDLFGERMVYINNPRTVDHKRKAKDRAHRKRVKQQKAIARRAGR